jgi:hypothetical protein
MLIFLSTSLYSTIAETISAELGKISSAQRYKKVRKGLQDNAKICARRTRKAKYKVKIST